MTNDSNTDMPHEAAGAGERLQEARVAMGMSVQEASTKLRMPLHVVQAMEVDDWQRLGAPVFIRGQLRSYARLLGVDLEPLLSRARIAAVEPVELVSYAHTPRYRRLLDSAARRAVYVVITVALVVPVWWATRPPSGGKAPSMASLDASPREGEVASVPAAPQARSAPSSPVASSPPYVASLASLPRASSAPAFKFRMIGDSWVQVTGADGRILEKGLLKAGDERSFNAGEIDQVVLGNASAVEVQQVGSTVDTTPFRRANVARFAVSSDGSVVPVSD